MVAGLIVRHRGGALHIEAGGGLVVVLTQQENLDPVRFVNDLGGVSTVALLLVNSGCLIERMVCPAIILRTTADGSGECLVACVRGG